MERAQRRTIVVTGVGKASAQPSKATVTLGVSTVSLRASEALNTNSISMNQVLTALKQAGVNETDIETTMFTLLPRYDHRGPDDPQLKGFEAIHLFRTVTDNNDVSLIIDRAVEAGANRINNVVFTLDREKLQELQREARQNAVADAREKADTIATSLDVQIAGVASAIEDEHRRVPSSYRMAAVREGPPITPPSETSVRVSLRVTYLIE